MTKPHQKVLRAKEDEQWTAFIREHPEGSYNPTFDRVIKEFFSDANTSRRAVNFGSGGGREEVYLIKNEWEVLSIDVSAYSGQLISEKSLGSKGKSSFFHGKFIDAELEGQYDLIMSFYALPFENKNNLISLIKNITNHLKPEGILLVNFFGHDHYLVKTNQAYGISQAELFSLLLLNNLKILNFENKTYLRNNKATWEVLEVVATISPKF